jgi:hypothetical protein
MGCPGWRMAAFCIFRARGGGPTDFRNAVRRSRSYVGAPTSVVGASTPKPAIACSQSATLSKEVSPDFAGASQTSIGTGLTSARRSASKAVASRTSGSRTLPRSSNWPGSITGSPDMEGDDVQASCDRVAAPAKSTTTTHGANFQTVSSRKPVSASAKSRGVKTALVQTGL